MKDTLMIDVYSSAILNESKCTLRETSYDEDSSYYMTNSEINVVFFDRAKEKYAEKLQLKEKQPMSVDALHTDNSGKMYLIEFRNRKMDRKSKREVNQKIFESLLILTDELCKNISCTRQNLSFILVYNETKNPSNEIENSTLQDNQSRNKIGKYISKKAKEDYIRFGLKRFKRLYFKDVYTVTEDEFENDFVRNWEKDEFSKSAIPFF